MPDEQPAPQPSEAAESGASSADPPQPSGPQPSGAPPGTGEPRVDAALAGLARLPELPVTEHPGVYERVHEQLVEVLGELHSGSQNR